MFRGYCTNRLLSIGFISLCTTTVFITVTTSYKSNSNWFLNFLGPGFRSKGEYFKQSVASNVTLGRPIPEKGIPKILHQIWNNEAIPAVFQQNIRGLVAHNNHPKWTYYFWTIDTGTRLIKKEFPKLLPRYLKAAPLLKADILRLAVLYQYGGVYFDLDTVSLKPLDPFMETHNCSLVTDPDEHVFYLNQPKKQLLVTNSAMFCKPKNWFILEIIQKLYNLSPHCRDAVKCTGPVLISKHYEYRYGTNRSSDLPIIVDNRLFEDMVDPTRHGALKRACIEPFRNISHEWAREVCRNWIKRGRDKRNISEMAFTYHTWFHTTLNPGKLKAGPKKNITELVKHVTFYND